MGAQDRFSEQDYRDTAEFRVALHTFLHLADERAREVGVTPKQWALLLLLRGHQSYPSVTIRELSESLQTRQSSASLLVDRAVRAGFVDRRENPMDRREAVLCLTDLGQSVLDEVMEANRKDLGQLDWKRFGQMLRETGE